MSLSDFTGRVKRYSNLMITLYGNQGSGKTTLAATFSNPYFIRFEPGLQREDIDTTKELLSSTFEYENLLRAMTKEDHKYKTLVIDSITKLDRIIVSEVLELDDKKRPFNQAHGGYGAAKNMVVQKHETLKKMVEILAKTKNMNVVFICHSKEEQRSIASEQDTFLYSDIDLQCDDAKSCYVKFVDVVGKIYVPFAVSAEKEAGFGTKAAPGRAKTGNIEERVFHCLPSASQATKNNLGIKKAFRYKDGENPLIEWIKDKKRQEAQTTEKVEEIKND